MCEKNFRLLENPEMMFEKQFTDWIDYLNIERIYYNLETCKNKIREYLLLFPEIIRFYDLPFVISELYKKDASFPLKGL